MVETAQSRDARKQRGGKLNLLSFKRFLYRAPESPGRILAIGVLVPLLGAIALCGIGSICPVRLDHRALQDLLKFQNTSLPQSAGNFVFLSRDNSIESARTATFGLRQLAFPNGSIYWVALKEQCTDRKSTRLN